MKKIVHDVVAASLLIFSLALTGLAQKQLAQLPIDTALSTLSLAQQQITLSPDGQWVAYVLTDERKQEIARDERYKWYTRTGVSVGLVGSDIWITNTQTGQSKSLTEGKGSSWSPLWSPDGRYLAFYSDHSGPAHLWVWERSSGALRLMSEDIVHFPMCWTPDSKQILIGVLPEGKTVEDMIDSLMGTSTHVTHNAKEGRSTVVVYRSQDGKSSPLRDGSFPHQSGTFGRVSGDIVVIDVTSGKARRIARDVAPHTVLMSPDGDSVAYMSYEGRDTDTSSFTYDLVVRSLQTAQPLASVSGIHQGTGHSVSWSPNGGVLAYTTSDGGLFTLPLEGNPRKVASALLRGVSAASRPPLWDSSGRFLYLLGADSLWKVSVSEGTTTQVAGLPNRKLIEAVQPAGGGRFWSPDGGRSMVVLTRDEGSKRMGFYEVDLISGQSLKLIEDDKDYGMDPRMMMDISADGRKVAYCAQDAQRDEEVWVTGIDFAKSTQLTHINPQLERYVMGAARLIEWRGPAGERLQGALLLPAGYEAGKHYPLVVYPYGGAFRSVNVNRFGLMGSGVENMQLLATRGYAVLLPDAPLHVGTPLQDLATTVLPGVDKVIAMGIADPDRLGVMGQSYGGYCTLALIVQTTRFRAAVMRAGQGDLISMYGSMEKSGFAHFIEWSEKGQGEMGGTPWKFRNRYIENSPIFNLDKVETPLLIIHGGADSVVPVYLADEVFVGLRRLGKEVEYAKYEGEDHAERLWSYANQTDYLTRMIAWFDKHLKPAQSPN